MINNLRGEGADKDRLGNVGNHSSESSINNGWRTTCEIRLIVGDKSERCGAMCRAWRGRREEYAMPVCGWLLEDVETRDP